MSKVRGQDHRDRAAGRGGGDEKRQRRCQKHLYLVLDDWDKGYSVYKMDADSFCSAPPGSDEFAGPEHLQDPPVLRLESSAAGRAPAPHNGVLFSAMGSKIFALMSQRCCLVYDTETSALGVGAHAPLQMVCGFGISVTVGGVLYALTYRSFDRHHPIDFEAMSWTAPAASAGRPATEGWSWKALPPPPPEFDSGGVNSYALHPDGCTIFMTTANKRNYTICNQLSTYSFNTKNSEWQWHGEWGLPFLGRAHFDIELDAWVGLHPSGCISCCQVVSPTYYNKRTPSMYLDCKTTKEKLFGKDRERHMDASLTYMGMGGTGGRFCLIECVSSKELDDEQTDWEDDDDCVINLTIFGLKYNHKGELQTTHHQSRRSFLVPSRHSYNFSPFAFWM